MSNKIKLEIELDQKTFDLFEEHALDQHDMNFKSYMEDFLQSYAKVIQQGNENKKN